MLTIFTCPKPFKGHVGITQRNAIQSWLILDPKPDVILMGDDEGISEAARDFNVRHIPDVKRNEYGTPLISSLFEEAEKAAEAETMCYVNGDIIFIQDFMEGIDTVLSSRPNVLMVGRRWNLDIREPLTFEEGWQRSLASLVAMKGKLYPYFAIDYFVFPRNGLGKIPPFAIGRPAWDNWVIYQARSSDMTVIDMTRMVTVIHQNHDYSHHPQGWKGAMMGEESKQNIAIAGTIAHVHSLLDASHQLTEKGVKRRFPPLYHPFYLYKTFVVLAETYPAMKPVVSLIKAIGARITARR